MSINSYTSKKIFLTLFYLSLFFVNTNYAQDCDLSTRNMVKYLGTSSNDKASVVGKIGDNGYIVAGSKFVGSSRYFYIIRMDLCGELLWEKLYNYGTFGLPAGIVYTDGFIYITTYIGSPFKTAVVKFDLDGTVIDSEKFGGGSTYPRRMIHSVDDKLIISGSTTSSGGPGNTDIYIAKTSFDGTFIWKKQIGKSSGDFGHNVTEDSDGSFIIPGYTRGYIPSVRKGLVVKINSDGNLLWGKEYYNGSGHCYFGFVKEVAGFYYFTGRSNYGTSGGTDGLIVKTNLEGDIIWSRFVGTSGDDELHEIGEKDGVLLLSGTAYSPTKGIELYVATMDYDGNLIDYASFGTDNDEVNYLDFVNFGTETGGFFGIGTGNTGLIGGEDILFYRFNSIADICNPSDVELIVIDADIISSDFDATIFTPSWSFIDTPYTPTATDDGNGFICETIVIDTCIVHADFEYTINDSSSSDGATGGCILSEVHFTDLSTVEEPTLITDWSWDFGDGDSSTDEDPDHIYSSAGTYTITLTVETDSGCTDTFTLDIEMMNGISVDVSTIEPTCFGFSDGSLTLDTTDGFGEVIFVITDEDGEVVNEDNSNSAFTLISGWYYYTVSDDSECEVIDSIFLDEPSELDALFEFSVAGLSSTDGATGSCISSNVSFTDLSTIDLPETISSWLWDFGDGDSSTDENPDHTYSSADTYTITLTVETDAGCTDTYTLDIIMTDGLSIDPTIIEPTCFELSDGSISLEITSETGEVIFVITDEDGTLINEDNSNSVDELTTGWYYYTVTDETECNVVDSVFIDEPGELIASFEYIVDGLSSADGLTSGCTMNTVHFNDLSTVDAPSTIVNWDWNFGDGTSSSLENPDHNYTSTGNYTITLTIESDEGCMSTYTLDIEINTIALTISSAQPTCYNFSDGSINMNMTGGSGDYLFEIKSESGTLLNISNSNSAFLLSSGLYYYSVVDNLTGCSESGSLFLDQPDAIIANFTFSPYNPTPNDLVTFTNLSIGATLWQWNFGDGNYSMSENPTHTYTTFDNYTITLIASDGVCTDTASVDMIMTENIIFYVPNTFTPDGNSYNEIFSPVFTAGYDIYDYHLTILNRWGEIVFESYNSAYGWDGTYGNTSLVEDGVYIWLIEFGDAFTDKKYTHYGHITLLK